jgi:hypothetical protein
MWTRMLLVCIGILAACGEVPTAPLGEPPAAAPSTPGFGKAATDGAEIGSAQTTSDCPEIEMRHNACDPGSGGGGWAFFNDADPNLYEAPGDPSPGQPGVWLGSEVSPAACFETGGGVVSATDPDADGLANACEFAIARSFAPMLHYSNGEQCPGGEPTWAAKRFPNGVVRMAYMMSYYKDCGYDTQIFPSDHTGDSEMVMVEVKYNAGTQRWEFSRMWLSAHFDAKLLGFGVDESEMVGVSRATFRNRHLGFPNVFVAEDKHANYYSDAECENTGFYDYRDTCGSLYVIRFPVEPGRNAGSRYVDLFGGCFGSSNFILGGRTECYYTSRSGGFRGWQSANYGTEPPSYHTLMFAGYIFENYFAEDASYTYTTY